MHVRLKTRLETKERRSHMRCRVFEVKIDKSHLSKSSLEHLNRIFLEAKWLYNYLVENAATLKEMNSTKIKSVPVKTPDGVEERGFKAISSQMRQGVQQRLWTNLKGLSAAKASGNKVGRLKFKSRVDSVPLNQLECTYFIDKEAGKARFQCLEPWLRVNGLEQIPDGAEVANAHLVRRRGDFFLMVTTFSERASPEGYGAIGVDAGCETQLTLSNGVKISWDVSVPDGLKKLGRKLSRKRARNLDWKESRKYWKLKDRLGKAYARWANRKRDIRNKVVSVLTKRFDVICVQDENVKGWQAGGHGRKVSKTGIGGTMTALRNKAATPVVVDRFCPTTRTCSKCGAKGEKLKLWERTFECRSCGNVEDRDVNAANNVLNEGLTQLPAERRTMPPEGGASGLMESLARIPGVHAKLCPMNGAATA
jgi:transposase